MSGSRSVCVIGAGPGGLAMARLLVADGHDVTVLEITDRAGGMCRSVEYDNQWFDVGANYVTKDYREVRAMAAELGLALTSDQAFQHQVSLDTTTGKSVPVTKTLIAGTSRLGLLLASLRYFWFQWKYRKVVRAPGFQGAADHDDLMCDVASWLERHKMQALTKLLMIPVTAMGFGTLDRVPTPHALRYINAPRMWSMLLTGMNIPQKWPKRFTNGFGNAWQMAADRLTVEYETETTEITRGEQSVSVTTTCRGHVQMRTFDRLVIACPPDFALRFLDASEEERELFGAGVIERSHYVVATAVVDDFEPWVVNTLRPTRGVFGEYPPPVGNPYIFGKQWRDSRLTLYYAPLAEHTEPDVIRGHMREVSAQATADDPNTRFVEWKDFAHWPEYFPHVSVDDMRSFRGGAGWYDRVEAIQGHRNTYYCHGVLSFELVELVMRYARHLKDHHFS